jgi:hypothetical protein
MFPRLITEADYITLDGRYALTGDEIRYCAYHGIDRRMKRLDGNHHCKNKVYKSVWDDDVESCCAECAFCKWHGVFWSGLGHYKSPDSAVLEDVKWTRYPDGYLGIHPQYDNNTRFVLMDGYAPVFRVIGWAYGGEAKKEEWWDAQQRIFTMKRRFLHPYTKKAADPPTSGFEQ